MDAFVEAKKSWRPLAEDASPEPLPDGTRLVPSKRVVPSRGAHGIEEIDAVWRVCSFEPEDADRLARLWPLLDGRHTVRELCAAVGGTDTHWFLTSLYQHALLVNAGETPVPALAFHDHAVTVGRTWLSVLAAKAPFSDALARSPSPSRLLLGWLLDQYHYVSGAAGHVGSAIVHAPSERLQLMLSEHLSHEYWHASWLATGLRAGGLRERDVLESLPLPATLGAMSYLRTLAATDALGYFATIGVRESDGSDFDDRAKTWERHLEVLPEAVIAPFRDHELLDMQEKHASISAEAFVGMGTLAAAQQRSVLKAVLSFARMTTASMDEVVRYHSDPTTELLVLPSCD